MRLPQVKQLFSDLAKAVATQEEGCQVYDVYTQTRSKDIPSIILHEKYVKTARYRAQKQLMSYLEIR